MQRVLFYISLMLLPASSGEIKAPDPASVGPESSIIDYGALVCEAEPAVTVDVASLKQLDLIVNVSQRFDVPPGIIYGIWQKETKGLRGGWSDERGWYRALRLSYRNGKCVKAYGASMCWKNWLRLKTICDQRRADGQRVCDPMQVRTAYALEMGPMQFVPSTLLRQPSRGKLEWTRYAVDYDGDGVIDPFSLPDAMASAAKYLRCQFDRKVGELGEEKAWRYAIIRYNGSAAYYYGKRGDPGVLAYWQQWQCVLPGSCVCQSQI